MIHITLKPMPIPMHPLPSHDTRSTESYHDRYAMADRCSKHWSSIEFTIYHGVCTATKSEQQIFDDFMLHERHPAKWQLHHQDCACDYGSPRRQRLDVQLLRSCRQIYLEARHVPWVDNTFSFSRPKALEGFLKMIDHDNATLIKNLHLSLNLRELDIDMEPSFDTTFNPILVRQFCNLQSLHLCIDQNFWGADDYLYMRGYREGRCDWFLHLLQLQSLPLKLVTVVLTDSRFTGNINHEGLPPDAYGKWRWTPKEKKVFAEHLRARLLDPNGAQGVDQVHLTQPAVGSSNICPECTYFMGLKILAARRRKRN